VTGSRFIGELINGASVVAVVVLKTPPTAFTCMVYAVDEERFDIEYGDVHGVITVYDDAASSLYCKTYPVAPVTGVHVITMPMDVLDCTFTVVGAGNKVVHWTLGPHNPPTALT
jgi:hypothetical protein